MSLLLFKEKSEIGLEELSTFLNPYSYIIARKNIDLYSQFDNVYVDGILLTRALRIVGKRVARKSFDMTSIGRDILTLAADSGTGIVLVGGREEVTAVAAKVLQERFPGLQIRKYYSGYFSSRDDRSYVLNDICANHRGCIVVVGMGTPLQEKFLQDLVGTGWQGTGYTCGGFLHQTARTTTGNYYPEFFNKYNLRWLYRIIDEPKLLTRYLIKYPQFLLLFLWDYLKSVRRSRVEK